MVIHMYMYIAPRQGQTTLWAQNIFININLLSICSFLASFLPLNDIFLFFPIQMNGWPKLTLLENGQGHPRVMIYIFFVEFHCLMLHVKFQNHRPSGSGEKKVQVGKDQEKAQSEKDSHSKNRGGKKPNQQSGTYTMKTFRKPNEQLFSQ